MNILGINAFCGDASAALIKDGILVAAIAEERLSRRRHWAGFPAGAVKAVLAEGGISIEEVDHVALSRDPAANLYRKSLFAVQKRTSASKVVARRFGRVARVPSTVESLTTTLGVSKRALRAKIHRVEHHKAHLASSFFVSPFEEAAALSIGGFGDFVSSMRGLGRDRELDVLDRVTFPHSIGLFYTALTQFLGFDGYGDEWKVSSLAPFGKPTRVEEIGRLIRGLPGGGFELDLDYFRHHREPVELGWSADGVPHFDQAFSPKLIDLLGPPRAPDDPEYFGKWADIAHSTQVVYEDLFLDLLTDLQRRAGVDKLCLTGACALNSVANGKIFERSKFRRLFAHPAAEDDGTAMGAAFYVEHAVLKQPRRFVMRGAYTGPEFDDGQVEAAIERSRRDGWDPTISVRRLEDVDLYREVARAVADGRIVGWFQGRMELGARPLGNRSVLADPRRGHIKDLLHRRIGQREIFGSFALSVLEEKLSEICERSDQSPFLMLAHTIKPAQRDRLPAVTHVDATARVHTVNASVNPRYHALISEFDRQTGVPLLLNTSFNEREPLVSTPDDALACYFATRIDVLALGNWVLTRPNSSPV
jgi:carbamoyltransferase